MSVQNEAKNLQRAKYAHDLHVALSETGGNTRATACKLGVSREWVRRWVNKLGIDVNQYRQAKSYRVVLGDKALGTVRAAGYDRAKTRAVEIYKLNPTEADLVVLVEAAEGSVS